MQQVTLAQASQDIPYLIEAALNGEEIIIITGNKSVKLTPMLPVKHYRQPGSAKGLVKMADDFDAPLEDFQEYM